MTGHVCTNSYAYRQTRSIMAANPGHWKSAHHDSSSVDICLQPVPRLQTCHNLVHEDISLVFCLQRHKW